MYQVNTFLYQLNNLHTLPCLISLFVNILSLIISTRLNHVFLSLALSVHLLPRCNALLSSCSVISLSESVQPYFLKLSFLLHWFYFRVYFAKPNINYLTWVKKPALQNLAKLTSWRNYVITKNKNINTYLYFLNPFYWLSEECYTNSSLYLVSTRQTFTFVVYPIS